MEILKEIAGLISRVREQRPLVHHITNYVTANDCANMVLALGGAPVMADAQGEVEEMVALASALVLNTGTLNPVRLNSMLLAGIKANELGIPVILDPVGVGATTFRAEAMEKILNEVQVAVVRGNMAEIKFLTGQKARIRGVDSLEAALEGEQIALGLAQKRHCVVGITGEKDLVSDGKKLCLIENGHQIMSRITGTGCMCTSLIGTFSGVTRDYFLSTAAGILTMGLSGDFAVGSLKDMEGAGTFRLRLFDSVFNLSEQDILKGGRIYEQKAGS